MSSILDNLKSVITGDSSDKSIGIIAHIIDYINTEISPDIRKKYSNSARSVLLPTCRLNSLKTDKTSLMACIEGNIEEKTDITGFCFSGSIPLGIYYRLIATPTEFDEFEALQQFNNLVGRLISDMDKIVSKVEGFWFSITGVTIVSSAKLVTCYDNGTKDFNAKLIINYER